MRLNADFSKRVLIYSRQQVWIPSPIAGVERRMLDRIGDEVARATSIVRYVPGSYFSSHTHNGGEEFLVLEGVFSDEHGDYGPGAYVRNPVGSSHKPFSENGCTIFVKLWQMDKDDQEFVRLDTGKMDWRKSKQWPCSVKPLAERFYESVYLMLIPASTIIEEFGHDGGAEVLVLRGQLSDGKVDMPSGTWLRNPPGYFHRLTCNEETRAYVKMGHLASAVKTL